MPSLEQLEAFIVAAEKGSFSAAARHLGKAQSAISHAVMNLEIDANSELFDRSGRSPQLTKEGQALLGYAKNVLQSHREFMAAASLLGETLETKVSIAIEQNVSSLEFWSVFVEFEKKFPYIELELLVPGEGDVPDLIRTGRADIGLMIEKEFYPQGFNFRGIGHVQLIPVCNRDHPLVKRQPLNHSDLRSFRQLATRSRNLEDKGYERDLISSKSWLSESPYLLLALLETGIGWAFLHEPVVRDKIKSGELVSLELSYQQADTLQGIDVVWTEQQPLGKAGQWLLNELFDLDIGNI